MYIGLRYIERSSFLIPLDNCNQMKNSSFESLTPPPFFSMILIFFFCLLLDKSTQDIGLPQQNSTILDFCEILEMVGVKSRSQFWMDLAMFHGAWGISTPICIVYKCQKWKRYYDVFQTKYHKHYASLIFNFKENCVVITFLF